jgi:hypothetical protein
VGSESEHWPKGAEFHTEQSFSDWLIRYRNYRPPDKRFDVVKHAGKVFAVHKALVGFDGIGVVVDVPTQKKIPKALIEKQLEDVCVAHFPRTGYYTDTGLVFIDCRHPQSKRFLDSWANWYLGDRFKKGPQFHDGIGFDFALRQTQVPARDLSGEHHKLQHPLKKSALAGWFA